MLDIHIMATPEEIAALVHQLQEQQQHANSERESKHAEGFVSSPYTGTFFSVS